ncbi:MAG: tRNA uridine-5-carboxymethylaminomethyl(34) synthesis GTPase MnmE [Bacteroidetes bacterium]|nr:tRNA uridine-5-carboxymethylaminomethyl(34) synthesis GTPase MnmE [Bacteroidota bacterium]MBK7573214.1 tRNA uridine-5-carboxymethylaminomethyl(34) synthesis GTPase MnmE [Bacteroidota bacterium]
MTSSTETIAALATPPGMGAIAVVRLSGTRAIEIADEFFIARKKGVRLVNAKSHTLHFGVIKKGGEMIDEVLISVFKGPHSYTGENTVEISCHGSVFIQQQILSLCQQHGARYAQPGEFTLRAFLNRKLDLSQAEAVADLIASDSAGSHKLALEQMRGGFSAEITMLRQELIHFASLIELELDFAEEDVEFANRDELKQTINKLQKYISRLIESFDLGNVIRTGIPVVIAGKPNVGKSTLLNALLNEDRAIVSEIAGTTRDTIEEEITLGGIKFRFIDTAGIRETKDAIESIGVSKTFEKMKQSPVVLYLFDLQETGAGDLKIELEDISKDLHTEIRLYPIGNKVDKENSKAIQYEFSHFSNITFISAKEKINIDSIVSLLLSFANSGTNVNGSAIVTNVRHIQELRETAQALTNVYNGLEQKVTNDFIAGDLRMALHHLGLITGAITTDDLLENIFSKFCIGK